MQGNQSDIRHDCREKSLGNADHRGCLSCFLQLRKPEFISDVERNEAQCSLGQHRYFFQIFTAVKAKSRNRCRPQDIRSYQYAGYQESRHVGEIQVKIFKYTSHHQPCKKSKGHCQKNPHSAKQPSFQTRVIKKRRGCVPSAVLGFHSCSDYQHP